MMRLNAWTWLIFGAIISVVAGYIYLFIPKNGGPNNAMALFFFIGVIFIIIGVVQLFFKRADDKEIFESVKVSEEKSQDKTIEVPIVESKPNKIDEEVSKMIERQEKSTKTNNDLNRSAHLGNNMDKLKVNHTNTYSQLHQYRGPVHTPSTGAHAQHPVAQHVQQHATQHHTAVQQHRVQNVAEYSLKCGKCGNVNSGHSNYCHQCGGRLK
ncbi:MAG: hypothetical protein ACP5NW_05085 [Candidatus Woesearchaeota archaeon]